MTSDSDFLNNSNDSESYSSEKPKKRNKCNGELKYNCPVVGCGEKFKRSTYLDRHEYHNHTKIKKYACTTAGCDKRYIIYTHLVRHIKTFHGQKQEQEPKRIKCSISTCVRYFNTETNMERHVRQYHENPKIYYCTHCSFSCRHKLQFCRHVEKHENGGKKIKNSRKTYTCETCNEIFTKWSALVMHRRKLHPPQCAICDQTFSRRTNLRSHLLDHKKKADKTTFPCPYDDCTRSYLQKRNLQTHIYITHEGKNFKCPVEGCSAVLSSKRRQNCHIELHSKEDLEVERKKQTERKDKGSRKISSISILAEIAMKTEYEKRIIDGRGKDIIIECSNLITTSDSDGEEIHVPKDIRLVVPETE